MFFKEIPGLQSLKKRLIESVYHQQIAHAQLFFGKEGGANLALALAFSRYLHCENRQPEDACGACNACKKYNKLIFPDLNFVFPVSSTKKVSEPQSRDFLKEWRSFLLTNPYASLTDWLALIEAENKQGNISVGESRSIIQTLSLKAFEGEFKILLLWLPEMLNIQAANALLKILEEPPPQTIFLLVCNDNEKLLATIISRVQMVFVPDLSDKEVQEYLIQKFQTDEKKAAELAYLSDGNLNEAYRLLHDNSTDNHTLFRNWMVACYKKDIKTLTQHTEEFAKLGKESQKNLFQYGLRICRDTLILQNGSEKLLRLTGERLKFLEGFAKSFDFVKSEILYQELNEACYHLERNANPKITFLDVSLKLAKIIN